MRQTDANDVAAIAVFERVRASGEQLTMRPVWSVIGELGSNAYGPVVYHRQARE